MSTIASPPVTSAVFAGIDWGGSFHQLCLVDADGVVLLQRRFDHTVDGLTGLIAALSTQHGLVRVAIERADGILVERLMTLDVEVFCVSPKISARATTTPHPTKRPNRHRCPDARSDTDVLMQNCHPCPETSHETSPAAFAHILPTSW